MTYQSSEVKCPFYHHNSNKGIMCEGSFSDFCWHNFATEAKRKKYMTQFCCDNYKKCELSQILIKKYNFKYDITKKDKL